MDKIQAPECGDNDTNSLLCAPHTQLRDLRKKGDDIRIPEDALCEQLYNDNDWKDREIYRLAKEIDAQKTIVDDLELEHKRVIESSISDIAEKDFQRHDAEAAICAKDATRIEHEKDIRIGELEAAVKNGNADIQTLKNMAIQVEDLKAQLVERDLRIQTMQNEKEQAKTDHEQHCETYRTEIKSVKKQRDDAVRKIPDLEKAKATLSRSNGQMNENIQKLQATIDTRQSGYQGQSRKIGELVAENRSLRNSIRIANGTDQHESQFMFTTAGNAASSSDTSRARSGDLACEQRQRKRQAEDNDNGQQRKKAKRHNSFRK